MKLKRIGMLCLPKELGQQNDFENLSPGLDTSLMTQILHFTFQRTSQIMRVAMVKIVSISPQKLEHGDQICIPLMMFHVIGNIGLSLSVKLTYNPLFLW